MGHASGWPLPHQAANIVVLSLKATQGGAQLVELSLEVCPPRSNISRWAAALGFPDSTGLATTSRVNLGCNNGGQQLAGVVKAQTGHPAQHEGFKTDVPLDAPTSAVHILLHTACAAELHWLTHPSTVQDNSRSMYCSSVGRFLCQLESHGMHTCTVYCCTSRYASTTVVLNHGGLYCWKLPACCACMNE